MQQPPLCLTRMLVLAAGRRPPTTGSDSLPLTPQTTRPPAPSLPPKAPPNPHPILSLKPQSLSMRPNKTQTSNSTSFLQSWMTSSRSTRILEMKICTNLKTNCKLTPCTQATPHAQLFPIVNVMLRTPPVSLCEVQTSVSQRLAHRSPLTPGYFP